MEITIRGEPKEIARLVLEVQAGRAESKQSVSLGIDHETLGEIVYNLNQRTTHGGLGVSIPPSKSSKPTSPLETIKEAVASAIRGIEQAERMKEENLPPL